MSDDLDRAVTVFLDEADAVYGEYEQGYMDADAALSRLDVAISELRDAAADD
jgi:hypothetical protein